MSNGGLKFILDEQHNLILAPYEPLDRMSEELMTKPDWCPGDVWDAAWSVWLTLDLEDGGEDIARAILSERDKQRERDAVIAEDEDGHFSHWGMDRNSVVSQQTCQAIASAIRSNKTGE